MMAMLIMPDNLNAADANTQNDDGNYDVKNDEDNDKAICDAYNDDNYDGVANADNADNHDGYRYDDESYDGANDEHAKVDGNAARNIHKSNSACARDNVNIMMPMVMAMMLLTMPMLMPMTMATMMMAMQVPVRMMPVMTAMLLMMMKPVVVDGAKDENANYYGNDDDYANAIAHIWCKQ